MTATNSLTVALRLAESGWCPIPLMPLSKGGALSGYYETATSDERVLRDQWRRAEFRISHDGTHPERAELEPGIGVVLGRSMLAVLDADTPEQVAAVEAAFASWGIELGPPTVHTPGKRGPDGAWLHRDGKHWYFTLPEGAAQYAAILANTKIVLKVGPVGGPQGDLMTGKCYVVAAPTYREEGGYIEAGGSMRPLPLPLSRQLYTTVTEIAQKRERAAARAADGHQDERMAAWDAQTPWPTVLPEGYREVGTEADGCVRYLRPGGSSSHSATAHVPGCSHIIGAAPDMPSVVTFFTSELPDYVAAALAGRDGRSATKLCLLAFRDFGGDMHAARRAYGLTSAPGRHVRRRDQAHPPTEPSRPVYQLPASVLPRPAVNGAGKAPTKPETAVETPPAPLPETSTPDSVWTAAPPQGGEQEQRVTEDGFVPAVLPGLGATAGLPDPFTPRHLVTEVFAALTARAASVTASTVDWVRSTEAEAGQYMGRDNDERNWSDRHRRMRADRARLMGDPGNPDGPRPGSLLPQATTGDLAEAVPGVGAARPRSIIRAALPTTEAAGWIVRERAPYDTFIYRGPKKDATPEVADADWASIDTGDEADADVVTPAPAKPADETRHPAEQTSWLILRPEGAPDLPTFPPPTGASSVDPTVLPRDIPVLSRQNPTDPLIFVPPAGTDPRPAIRAVMASIPDEGILGVDVETTGTQWEDTLRLIQLGSATCAVVLDASDGDHLSAVTEALETHVLSGRVWATAHNSSFDALHLHRAGIIDGLSLLRFTLDTYILQTLVEAPLSDDEKKGGSADKRGLKALTSEWLDRSWSSRAEDAMKAHWATRKWRGQQGWSRTEIDEPHYLYYAGCDVVDAARLCATLLGVVESVAGGSAVIHREHLIAADAARMQLNGFLLDLPALARDEVSRQVDVERTEAAVQQFGIAKVNSPKEVASALNAERQAVIDARVAEAVAAGEDEAEARAALERAIPEITSTAKAILKALTWSRIAPALLDYRAVAKTAGTYTTAWPKAADESGRLHPNINTLKASTGRFSSSGPNMQNVPAPVRPYFIAGPGKSLVTSDFASIEMRVAAAYAGETSLTADYQDGLDPYREIAKTAFDTDDPTKGERDATKPILLGRTYTRGSASLAREQQSKHPEADFDDLVERAEHVMRQIDQRYPDLRKASYALAGRVRAGFTRITFDSGRSISIDPSSGRKAFNAQVQGAARELLVDAAAKLRHAGLGRFLWLPVHDEWVLIVDEDQAEEIKDRLVELMTTAFRGIPVVVEATVLGPHWKKA